MMQTIIEFKNIRPLFQVNKILSKRVRKSQHFYIFIVAVASLFLITVWSVFLLARLIEFDSEGEIQIAFSAGAFFVFALDVLFTLSRFQSGTLIEPCHLNIFPIGKLQKYNYNLALLFADYKSLIYLASSLVLAVFFLKEFSLLKAVLSFAIIFIFLLTMTMWSVVIYNVCGDFLVKIKSNALVVFYFLVIFLNLTIVTKKLSLLASLPIIGYVGNVLYALKASDMSLALSNVSLLFLSLLLGVLVLRFVPPRN